MFSVRDLYFVLQIYKMKKTVAHGTHGSPRKSAVTKIGGLLVVEVLYGGDVDVVPAVHNVVVVLVGNVGVLYFQ